MPVCAPGERHDGRREVEPRTAPDPVVRVREDVRDDLRGRDVQQVPATTSTRCHAGVSVSVSHLKPGAAGAVSDGWKDSPACFEVVAGAERSYGLVAVGRVELARQDGDELGLRERALCGHRCCGGGEDGSRRDKREEQVGGGHVATGLEA